MTWLPGGGVATRAAVIVLAAWVLAACGDSGSGEGAAAWQPNAQLVQAAVGESLVTNVDIERAPAGSPQRALLEWFQAVQFVDIEHARVYVAPSAMPEGLLPRFAAAVRAVGSALGRPRVLRVDNDGGTADVVTRVKAFVPRNTMPVSSDLESFPMRAVEGRWLLRNLDYLFAAAGAIDSRG
jgi:hypothetical protein